MSNAYLVQVLTAMPVVSAFANVSVAVENMQQRVVPPLYATGIRDVYVSTDAPIAFRPTTTVSEKIDESYFDMDVPFIEWAEGRVAPVYPEFDPHDAFTLITTLITTLTQRTHEWFGRVATVPPWGKTIDDIMQKAARTAITLHERPGSSFVQDVASARKFVEPIANLVQRKGHILGAAALNDETPTRRVRIVRDVVNLRFDEGYGPQLGAEILYSAGNAGRLVLMPAAGFDISSGDFLKAVNPFECGRNDLDLATIEDDDREGAFSTRYYGLHYEKWNLPFRGLMFLGIILVEVPQYVTASTFPRRTTSNDSTGEARAHAA